jgi:hypothetical protein
VGIAAGVTNTAQETTMDFGYTNDHKQAAEVRAWRDAAIADGWAAKPTYRNESIESAMTLEREGYVVQVLLRSPAGKWKHQAKLSLWGPDGLAISLRGPVYDWAAIASGQNRCNYCGATDVATERVGFAGRCCSSCIPAVRLKVERPGWCD